MKYVAEYVRYEVRHGDIIGRMEECDVCLDEPSVSRIHGKVTTDGDMVYLQIIDKAFGDPKSVLLRYGDNVQIGKLQFKWLRDPATGGVLLNKVLLLLSNI